MSGPQLGMGAGGWGWLVTGTLMGLQEISAAHVVVVGTRNFGPVAMAPLSLAFLLAFLGCSQDPLEGGCT